MPSINFPINAAPAIGFAILMIPLLDTLRVFGIRIIHQRSPFSPDRNHIHHLLLDKGLSHKAITMSLVGANLVFVLGAYLFRELGSTWIIFSIIAMFFIVIAALYFTRPRPRLFVAKSVDTDNNEIKASNIVPLTKDTVLEQKN